MILRRVVNRRIKVDDPDRALLPDDTENPQVSEVYAVLDYLATHIRVPEWVTRADVSDALRLNNYLWWDERRRELAWLRTGVRRKLMLAQLGAAVGTGKQGVRDRIDRLEALLAYQRPDEQLTREARRAARAADARREVETGWVDTHAEQLTAISGGFTAAAERYELADDEREWVDELAADAREQAFSPASMAVLGLAADELRTAPTVVALPGPRPYAVHGWLARADALRSEFAALGTATAGGDTDPSAGDRGAQPGGRRRGGARWTRGSRPGRGSPR
jgi:hypothetical protein